MNSGKLEFSECRMGDRVMAVYEDGFAVVGDIVAKDHGCAAIRDAIDNVRRVQANVAEFFPAPDKFESMTTPGAWVLAVGPDDKTATGMVASRQCIGGKWDIVVRDHLGGEHHFDGDAEFFRSHEAFESVIAPGAWVRAYKPSREYYPEEEITGVVTKRKFSPDIVHSDGLGEWQVIILDTSHRKHRLDGEARFFAAPEAVPEKPKNLSDFLWKNISVFGLLTLFIVTYFMFDRIYKSLDDVWSHMFITAIPTLLVAALAYKKIPVGTSAAKIATGTVWVLGAFIIITLACFLWLLISFALPGIIALIVYGAAEISGLSGLLGDDEYMLILSPGLLIAAYIPCMAIFAAWRVHNEAEILLDSEDYLERTFDKIIKTNENAGIQIIGGVIFCVPGVLTGFIAMFATAEFFDFSGWSVIFSGAMACLITYFFVLPTVLYFCFKKPAAGLIIFNIPSVLAGYFVMLAAAGFNFSGWSVIFSGVIAYILVQTAVLYFRFKK